MLLRLPRTHAAGSTRPCESGGEARSPSTSPCLLLEQSTASSRTPLFCESAWDPVADPCLFHLIAVVAGQIPSLLFASLACSAWSSIFRLLVFVAGQCMGAQGLWRRTRPGRQHHSLSAPPVTRKATASMARVSGDGQAAGQGAAKTLDLLLAYKQSSSFYSLLSLRALRPGRVLRAGLCDSC